MIGRRGFLAGISALLAAGVARIKPFPKIIGIDYGSEESTAFITVFPSGGRVHQVLKWSPSESIPMWSSDIDDNFVEIGRIVDFNIVPRTIAPDDILAKFSEINRREIEQRDDREHQRRDQTSHQQCDQHLKIPSASDQST